MILVVVALLVVASVPLTGGSLWRMSLVRFTHPWLVALALGLQLLITVAWTDGPPLVLTVLHMASYGLAVAFLWWNRRVPGLPVLGAGGLANLAAISANGGVMPASPRALELAGLTDLEGFQNSTAVEGARLAWLGDVFAIPEAWPFANVFSVGDVVLLVGVGVLVHVVGRWPEDGVDADAEPERIVITSEPWSPEDGWFDDAEDERYLDLLEEVAEELERPEPDAGPLPDGAPARAEADAEPAAADRADGQPAARRDELDPASAAAVAASMARVAQLVAAQRDEPVDGADGAPSTAVAPAPQALSPAWSMAAPPLRARDVPPGRCCASRRPHRCCTGTRRGVDERQPQGRSPRRS